MVKRDVMRKMENGFFETKEDAEKFQKISISGLVNSTDTHPLKLVYSLIFQAPIFLTFYFTLKKMSTSFDPFSTGLFLQLLLIIYYCYLFIII